MKRYLILTCVLVVLIGGSVYAISRLPKPPTPPVSQNPVPSEPIPDTPGGPVTVETVDVVVRESFPPQVDVVLSGYLPDPCTHISKREQTRQGDTFYLRFETQRTGDMCATVIVPFTETISLIDPVGFSSGNYFVDVNGTRKSFSI